MFCIPNTNTTDLSIFNYFFNLLKESLCLDLGTAVYGSRYKLNGYTQFVKENTLRYVLNIRILLGMLHFFEKIPSYPQLKTVCLFLTCQEEYKYFTYLSGLLSTIRHFLDSHHFIGAHISCLKKQRKNYCKN